MPSITTMRPINWRTELTNDLALATEKTRASWLSQRTVIGTFVRTVMPHVEAAFHRGRLSKLREHGMDVPELRAPLTERERQCAIGAARGLSSAEIGEELFLSTETVRTHMQRLFKKTGIHTRAGSVALLLLRGDITAGDVLGGFGDADA